jgi:DNA-binding CsgD family transcriptional regulator
MTDPAPTRPAKPRRTTHDRTMRANRIFARMLEGRAYPEIAATEGITVRRVRMIVQEALDRRDIEPRKEYAFVQVARLDSALRLVEERSPTAS